MGNKTQRKLLEERYGKYCMMCVLKGKGQLAKMRKLTYHHIVPLNRYKKRGIKGATTIGNGALLCRPCHEELEQLPEEEREELNRQIIKYKEDYDKGIRMIIPKEPNEEEYIAVQAYDYDKELQDKIFEDNMDEIRL